MVSPNQLNVAGAMPYRFPMSPFAQYAGLVDCMETTADATGSYPMSSGFYGCNPVFGNACMPGGPMCMPGGAMGFPGMYGYGAGFETANMTMAQLSDYSYGLQKSQLQRQVDYKHQLEDAEFRSTAKRNVVGERLARLHNIIRENNQDQVHGAFEDLQEAIKVDLKKIDPKAEYTPEIIETYAKTLYGEKFGNIGDSLRKNGDSPFWTGIKKGAFGIGSYSLGGLLMDKKSTMDNIAEIEGIQETKRDKAQKHLGYGVSFVLSALGAILLFKGIGKIIKPNVLMDAEKAAKSATG